jgi:steroid delta-isomerase-like uncharacterized protein
MSTADLKARTLQIFDTFNTHDAAATAALFAPDAVLDDVAAPRRASGPAQITRVYEGMLVAFPDLQVQVERMIAEGDTVVAEWTLRGTHQGVLLGIPATGRSIAVSGVSIIRFRDGVPTADSRVWDYAGLLRQIGLLPSRRAGAPE